MSDIKHVALIGCGFTGTSAFYQLVDKYPVEEITIFEATGVFGPGYPYKSDECRDYLLNNTTDTLCLTPDNKRAFLNWMRTRPDLVPDVEERGNLPRVYYGYFLEDVFRSTLTNASIKNIKVNLVSQEAHAINENDDGTVTIHWEDSSVTVDKAILTIGHCPNVDHYDKPSVGSRCQYYPNHVNEKSLDEISIDASVYILGASLSAFDVVGRLFSDDTGSHFERDENGVLLFVPGPNKRSVILSSRSGRLKKMKSRRIKTVKRDHFTVDYLSSVKAKGTLELDDIADAITKDCDLNNGKIAWDDIIDPYKGCNSQQDVDKKAAAVLEHDLDAAISSDERNILVDIFGDAGLEIWDIFAARLTSPEEEIRFRKKYETATLTFEASCPISTAEKLLALHRAGRLKIVKGVDTIEYSNNDDCYLINHEFGQDKTQVLVNTTGSVDRNVKSPEQPTIIRNMASEGLISPYVCGDTIMPGAEVDMNDFRVSGTKNIHLASQLLWGPGFYTSGAIIMATIVDRILKSLFNK